jgi:hypothetical protein
MHSTTSICRWKPPGGRQPAQEAFDHVTDGSVQELNAKRSAKRLECEELEGGDRCCRSLVQAPTRALPHLGVLSVSSAPSRSFERSGRRTSGLGCRLGRHSCSCRDRRCMSLPSSKLVEQPQGMP